MGLLNANFMGLYVYDDPKTSPYRVHVTSTLAASAELAVEDFWDNGSPLPVNNEFAFIVKPNGTDLYLGSGNTWGKSLRPLIGEVTGVNDPRSASPSGFLFLGEANNGTAGDVKLDLMAAATNTSIDLSRGVDEVVAKGVQCESETYTSLGASSWSVTCDGLIQTTISGGDKGVVSVLDIARQRKYVLVRFVLNAQDKNVASDDEDHISYFGQGIIESINLSGSFDSTQTYSATIRGYGNLMRFDPQDSI